MRPVGYQYLIEKYSIAAHLQHPVLSFIGPRSFEKIQGQYPVKEQHFTSQYEPEDTLGGHLEFALKYEGTNIYLISLILKRAHLKELIEYIQSKQTGKYARRLWYICEVHCGIALHSIPDLQMGNYIPLLDPDEYVTMEGTRSSRHRIEDNLFGVVGLAPLIRKTATIKKYIEENFSKKTQEILDQYPSELLTRAIQYLYTKETKSSYEIEKEVPDKKKAERFVRILKNAGVLDYLEKSNLVALQNAIVDPRYADADYRATQNYVGEVLLDGTEKVHFIAPRPQDVADLMQRLKELKDRGWSSTGPSFVLAVVISYLFVYIHPFEDGNGRIHRFLLHDVLRRKGFTPDGIIFPISATLLRNKAKYDRMLESISEPLMGLIPYDLDELGQMTVEEDTSWLYRYLDMTFIVQGMFEILTETIEKDLAEELEYLAKFDINMAKLKEVVDLPDKKLNLFIRLCLQNQGKLSTTKKEAHFCDLKDEEVAALEAALVRRPEAIPSKVPKKK